MTQRIKLTNYVTLAPINTYLAEKYIRENVRKLYKNSTLRRVNPDIEDSPLAPYFLNLVADAFMAMHPRGNKTHDDDLRRNFYNACHTIKKRSSRTKTSKMIDDHKAAAATGLGTRLRKAILAFEENGAPCLPKITQKMTVDLLEMGFISGHFQGETLLGFWLTDFGVEARKCIVRQDAMLAYAASVRAKKGAMETISNMDTYGDEETLRKNLAKAIELATLAMTA